MQVEAFFDNTTNTISYVCSDESQQYCAIIDAVWDYDPATGQTSTESAQRIADYIDTQGYKVEYILETHAHADHLSAAQFFKARYDAPIGIGRHITEVQQVFAQRFNLPDLPRDGSQFDLLFADRDKLTLGAEALNVLHTPGHTPACITFWGAGCAFVGDTLFMPDYGTARCDFPGGDAKQLFESVHKIYALPADTVLYLCHDYLPNDGRTTYVWTSPLATQISENIHINERVEEAEFVEKRQARDATLAAPRLLLPSIQVNIRAGCLPEPEENGVAYLKIPVRG